MSYFISLLYFSEKEYFVKFTYKNSSRHISLRVCTVCSLMLLFAADVQE